jgi:hypothetical protein
MSEEETTEMRFTIPGGEWWYFASMIQIGIFEPLAWPGTRMETRPNPHGCTIEITSGATRLAAATITSTGEQTTIAVIAHTAHAAVWQTLLLTVQRMAENARQIRRNARGPTGEDVIEIYYRSRAAGGKTTLRQLAAQYGFNPSYLSQVKKQYDEAGKWGAKVKAEPKQKPKCETDF